MYCTPYGQNFPATPLGGVAAHAAGACDVVETGERSSCNRQRAIKSTSTSGYFTTALAEDRGAASSLCPWTVDAQPGQRVNLTLYSFPIASDSAVGDSDSQRRPGHGL